MDVRNREIARVRSRSPRAGLRAANATQSKGVAVDGAARERVARDRPHRARRGVRQGDRAGAVSRAEQRLRDLPIGGAWGTDAIATLFRRAEEWLDEWGASSVDERAIEAPALDGAPDRL